MDEMNEVEFNLIMHSGNARSYAMEAIKEADKGNFEKANELIIEAKKELVNAQRSHSGIIQDEAAGKKVEITLLLMHSEDHLASSTIVVDLAKEIINLHCKYSKEEN
ncbi:PTS system, cellobiose-specific IIA component [Clostridium cavendishii DSM 21758]|uniref:PTS system, cellobiose-specific IIA component n=1 Tax=Clostridium cavendishii DSM 21758 TaxID=1121302 RepID=A0A1M6R2X8_9CLOT|nr:PTS lactose/cellobiose transporter subunit IIA [Clostridium cavendishii]SHK26829.1 PTS system, cellobiose-specific IIA component [Clostridium cavendishii DSM 21758]